MPSVLSLSLSVRPGPSGLGGSQSPGVAAHWHSTCAAGTALSALSG